MRRSPTKTAGLDISERSTAQPTNNTATNGKMSLAARGKTKNAAKTILAEKSASVSKFFITPGSKITERFSKTVEDMQTAITSFNTVKP